MMDLNGWIVCYILRNEIEIVKNLHLLVKNSLINSSRYKSSIQICRDAEKKIFIEKTFKVKKKEKINYTRKEKY